jgi:hypothetical protein
MLYDRLRITDQAALSDLWCEVMIRVYELGGIYTLNLHPERGVLCRPALERLLAYSRRQPLPIWLATLHEVEKWWRERRAFRFSIEPHGDGNFYIEAVCSPGAAILARHLTIDGPLTQWWGSEGVIPARQFTVHASASPCIALSHQTSDDVEYLLREQGFPVVRAEPEAAPGFAHFLDIPGGLGATRSAQIEKRSALVAEIEARQKPLLRFGVWPQGARAALAITGDIDSITVQDFFLRILEARQHV